MRKTKGKAKTKAIPNSSPKKGASFGQAFIRRDGKMVVMVTSVKSLIDLKNPYHVVVIHLEEDARPSDCGVGETFSTDLSYFTQFNGKIQITF